MVLPKRNPGRYIEQFVKIGESRTTGSQQVSPATTYLATQTR
jgi:hypothetical protein